MRKFQLPSIHKKYYYIVAVVKGKPFVDGAYNTREEAQKMAWRKLEGVVWQIEESNTKDRSRFTQQTHHNIWNDTGNIEEALKPIKHKI